MYFKLVISQLPRGDYSALSDTTKLLVSTETGLCWNSSMFYINYDKVAIISYKIKGRLAMSLSAHSHFGMWATGLVEEVSGIQPAPWFAWNFRIFIYSKK